MSSFKYENRLNAVANVISMLSGDEYAKPHKGGVAFKVDCTDIDYGICELEGEIEELQEEIDSGDAFGDSEQGQIDSYQDDIFATQEFVEDSQEIKIDGETYMFLPPGEDEALGDDEIKSICQAANSKQL